jgi:hypothetical protein
MTNLARRSSDYNWRGAEIELLTSHYSTLVPGVAAVEQNGVAAKGPQTWDEVIAGATAGLKLVPAEVLHGEKKK